jgi:hypothetical protein
MVVVCYWLVVFCFRNSQKTVISSDLERCASFLARSLYAVDIIRWRWNGADVSGGVQARPGLARPLASLLSPGRVGGGDVGQSQLASSLSCRVDVAIATTAWRQRENRVAAADDNDDDEIFLLAQSRLAAVVVAVGCRRLPVVVSLIRGRCEFEKAYQQQQQQRSRYQPFYPSS